MTDDRNTQGMRMDVGNAVELLAVMKDGKITMLVVSEPMGFRDVTGEIARLLHHKLSSPPLPGK